MDTEQRRLLKIFRQIENENLRHLTAELVHIRKEYGRGQQPRARYREAIDAYASRFGDGIEFLIQSSGSEGPQDSGPVDAVAQSRSGIVFERLALENFGSYGENTVFDFTPDGERNVAIVVGTNGGGKSTLFNGLNWALFGDQFLDSLKREKGREFSSLVNRRAIYEAISESRTVPVRVMLTFSVKGAQYYLVRETIVQPKSPSQVVVVDQSMKLVKIDTTGSHQELRPNSLPVILAAIPFNIRDFYLFDGEQINRFVNEGARHHIQRTIREVTGISAVDEAAQGLTSVVKDYQAEIRKHSTLGTEKLNATLEGLYQQIEDDRKKIAQYEQDMVKLTDSVEQIEAHLIASPDTKPYQLARNQAEQQLKGVEADIQTTRAAIQKNLNVASMTLGSNAVESLYKELETRKESGEIPGDISEQLLTELIELGTCICGSEAAEGTVVHENLLRRLEGTRARAKHKDAALHLFFQLGSYTGSFNAKFQALNANRDALRDLSERRLAIESQLIDISDTLKGMKEIDRASWEREHSAKSRELRNLGVEKASLKHRIEDSVKKVEEIKAQLRKEEGLRTKAGQLAVRRDWAEAAEKALRFIHHEFSALAQREIEEQTTRLWQFMLPNISEYEVKVTPEFELQVFDSRGTASMNNLSMGQQQCLGLAFIAAVAGVAESKPPLVIDMPFGRLDAETASSVATALPKLTEQLILLVLPETEWNEQTKAAINPRLARTYHITYDKGKQTTCLNETEGANYV